MARTVAELPSGTRITDYISLGVLTKSFPVATIDAVLIFLLKEERKAPEFCRSISAYL